MQGGDTTRADAAKQAAADKVKAAKTAAAKKVTVAKTPIVTKGGERLTRTEAAKRQAAVSGKIRKKK